MKNLSSLLVPVVMGAVVASLTGCASVSTETPESLTQKIRIEVMRQPTGANSFPKPEKAECTIGDKYFGLEFIGGALVELPPRKFRLVAECPSEKYGMARGALDPDANGQYPHWVQLRYGQNLLFQGTSPDKSKPVPGRLISVNTR